MLKTPDTVDSDTGQEAAERVARWLRLERTADERSLKYRIRKLRYQWEAGRTLKQQRDVLSPLRQWSKWLKKSEPLLGFGTPQRANQYIDFFVKFDKPRLSLSEEEVATYGLASRGKTNVLGIGGPDANWFTPKDVIEAARKVMGRIDIDPASHKKAQKTVRAGVAAFKKEDNGLEQEWPGCVWINPPYRERRPTTPEEIAEEGEGNIGDFAAKLIASLEAGVTTQAIWLGPNRPKSKWWPKLMDKAELVCIVEAPLNFRNPKRERKGASPFTYAIFYFGRNYLRFKAGFTKFGTIYQPYVYDENRDYDDPI